MGGNTSNRAGGQEFVMGRFGISFSDESGKGFRVDRKKYYATINHSDDQKGDGPFQRCLAWLSYIVMVLAAFFTFNSTALAVSADNGLIMLQDTNQSAIIAPVFQNKTPKKFWELRSTR